MGARMERERALRELCDILALGVGDDVAISQLRALRTSGMVRLAEAIQERFDFYTDRASREAGDAARRDVTANYKLTCQVCCKEVGLNHRAATCVRLGG